MAGLRNRFSSLFDEEEDEITTVIKETDDDSPNTRTTTIKRAGEKGNTTKGRAPTKGNTLLDIMQSYIPEEEDEDIWGGGMPPRTVAADNPAQTAFAGYPGQMGITPPQPQQPSQTIFDRLGEVNGGQRGMWGNTPFPGDPNAAGAVAGDPTGMYGGSPFPGDPSAAGAMSGDPSGMYGMSPFPGDPNNSGASGQMLGMQGVSPFPGDPNAAGAVAGDPTGMYGGSPFPGDPSNVGAVAGTSPRTSTSAFSPGGRDREQVVTEDESRVNEVQGTDVSNRLGNNQEPEDDPYNTSGGWSPGVSGLGATPTGAAPGQPSPGKTSYKPETTVKGAETAVVDSAENDQTSYTVQGHQPTMAETDALTRTWGKLAYDPKKRRDEYMKRLNKIYANTMALEALAIISGKRSRAGMYSKMAMGKLDAMQKFDSEDRLQQLTNSLYFNKSGEYAPPANKAEAHDALMRMGASLNEATAIVGHVPEAVASDLKEWYRYNPETNKVETRQYPGKKGMPGAGWSQNYTVANDKWKRYNPSADSSTGTQVANAQHLATQQALLEDMTPGTAIYNNQKNYVEILTGVLGQDVNKQKSFSDFYGHLIKDGMEPPEIDGVDPFQSWEEYAAWWTNDNNQHPQSFNGVTGGNRAGQGEQAASVQQVTYSSVAEAELAGEMGEIPVGAAIVVDGKVVGKWEGA